MLAYQPESRATAAELSVHKWLEGVLVQGEIEVAQQQAERGRSGGTGDDPAPRDYTPQLAVMGRI